MSRICNCVEALLLALVAAEALEHNAIVSRESQRIAQDIKPLVSSEGWEELVYEHSWLESPITEPMAELAIYVSLRDMKEKCQIETEEMRKMHIEGSEAIRAAKFDRAQQRYIDIKTKLLDMAKKLCEEKDGMPL